MSVPHDKLTQFAEAWNDLRNAVIGRGTAPPADMPAELVERVGNTYERWTKYLAEMSPIEAVIQTPALLDWLAQYRALVADARKVNSTFPVLATSWVDTIKGTKPEGREPPETGGPGYITIAIAAMTALSLLFSILNRTAGKGKR